MKAAVIREHGGPEVVNIEDIPAPKAGPGEVVVEVRAAALNHLDVWVRQGGRHQLEWPHVVGSDAAGTVVALGASVGGVAVGDEVVVNAGLACEHCEFCRRGEHSMCADYRIIGMHRPGTFAERVAVPARCVAPKPTNLDFIRSAALGIAHTTAWRMLFTRARLRPGETVLIHGIGGGAALAALQFVVSAGGRAVVTSSSEAKLKRAQEMGAATGINYKTTEDVAEAVLAATGGRGADIAFDAVGAATWALDFDAVRKGGRIVICGVTTGATASIDLQQLYWNQLTILGSTMGSDDEFRRMISTVKTAGIEPVIDNVMALQNVQEAESHLEAGEQFGKIVLTVR